MHPPNAAILNGSVDPDLYPRRECNRTLQGSHPNDQIIGLERDVCVTAYNMNSSAYFTVLPADGNSSNASVANYVNDFKSNSSVELIYDGIGGSLGTNNQSLGGFLFSLRALLRRVSFPPGDHDLSE